MRPVSKTIRRQLGAFDNSTAIAAARRLRLVLVNHDPFAIENANMRLVQRDIEASKILDIGSPLPSPGQSYRPSRKSSRSLPMLKLALTPVRYRLNLTNKADV